MESEMGRNLWTESGSGFNLLNVLMCEMEVPAQRAHDAWIDTKMEDLRKPDNPFRGLPPIGSKWDVPSVKRVRVCDLTLAECAELGLTYNPEDKQDVYHNWFQSYGHVCQVWPSVAGRNMLWMCSTINALSYKYGQDLSLRQLEKILEGVIDPATDEHFQMIELLNYTQHTSWSGAALTADGERYPACADLAPYSALGGRVKQIDEMGCKPAVLYILERVKKIKEAMDNP